MVGRMVVVAGYNYHLDPDGSGATKVGEALRSAGAPCVMVGSASYNVIVPFSKQEIARKTIDRAIREYHLNCFILTGPSDVLNE